ncbi:hypothetical protein [Paenibacillus terrae]|uniref:Uncharacterized protein n=1 Tax=Paenibacillus terrae TaxID=159743 RepID=A0A0D7WXV1_9BACL|nr:hypothetical protein [Paenibacillus terrae]KJD43784.1 hypothetical protein QD47_20805 [Paenibacillus terrae]
MEVGDVVVTKFKQKGVVKIARKYSRYVTIEIKVAKPNNHQITVRSRVQTSELRSISKKNGMGYKNHGKTNKN